MVAPGHADHQQVLAGHRRWASASAGDGGGASSGWPPRAAGGCGVCECIAPIQTTPMAAAHNTLDTLRI